MSRGSVQHPIMTTPLRLRIPASLAVALLGTSATVAVSLGSCQEDTMPDPIDAGVIDRRFDGGLDGNGGTGIDGELADADVDSPDGPVDAATDARPDAPVPPDAAVG
jgi:hypothetical protein